MTDIVSTSSSDSDREEQAFQRQQDFLPDRKLDFAAGIEKPPTRTPANIPRNWAKTKSDTSQPKCVPMAKSKNKKRKSSFNHDADDEAGYSNDSVGVEKMFRADPLSTGKGQKHQKNTAVDSSLFNSYVATRRTNQTRSRKKRQVKSIPLPQSIDEATEADRCLISMRDAGMDWAPIRAKWKELTGEEPATSTLPNRYVRVKTAVANLSSSDRAILLEAKRLVEETFERSKWENIADTMVTKFGAIHGPYFGPVLQRVYKRMVVEEGAAPPMAVQDRDFMTGSEHDDHPERYEDDDVDEEHEDEG